MNIETVLTMNTESVMSHESLTIVNQADLDAACFSCSASLEDAIMIVGFQKAADGSNHVVEIGLGNMFAKKVNLRDNFSNLNEFRNKYKDLDSIMEDVGTKSTPETFIP